MNYEQLTREMDAARAAGEAIDAFAEKQKDGNLICPRCGQPTMKEKMSDNLTSTEYFGTVYICEACINDEAIRNMKGKQLMLKDWAVAKWGKDELEKME